MNLSRYKFCKIGNWLILYILDWNKRNYGKYRSIRLNLLCPSKTNKQDRLLLERSCSVPGWGLGIVCFCGIVLVNLFRLPFCVWRKQCICSNHRLFSFLKKLVRDALSQIFVIILRGFIPQNDFKLIYTCLIFRKKHVRSRLF